MKKPILAALLAVPLMAICGGVAVLENAKGRHTTEFDAAFAELGVTPARFNDTKESFENFISAAGGFDLVLVSPLFNYDAKLEEKTSSKPLRDYVENGGLLVMTDASYAGVRRFFEPAVEDLEDIETGKCTSSQWAVLGHTANVEPVHPIRSFPNRLTNADSWPHFERVPSGWRTLANCSQGKSVIIYKEIGKGAVVVSALRLPSHQGIENMIAYSRLKKSGVQMKSLSMTELRPGDGKLELELAGETDEKCSLSFVIENEKRKNVAFKCDIVGTKVELPFNIPFRGPVVASLYLDGADGRKLLFSRKTEMAPLMKVGANAYRGILSTKRRVKEVKFPVYFAPDKEDITAAKLTLAVFDSASNQVTSVEMTLPTNDVPREMWVPVALSDKLFPGGYRIDATLFKNGNPRINADSSAFFEILAPRRGQTVIDDDGTFLVNGKPFFPLGIYHTNPSQYGEVAEIGFNMQQFWAWSIGDDGFGAPLGLDKAAANKLKCLWEPNHRSADIYRETIAKVGWHSAVFMWYVADEPAEGSEAMMTLANDCWHEDKHHPTYVASCRPDLFAHHAKFADVFGFDPYGDMQQVVDWCRLAEKEVAPHQATICVPWADRKDLRIVKATAYTAIAHNIRGIIWYCWSQAGGGPLGVGIHSKPESKAYYKEMIAELNTLMPHLTSTERRTFEEGDIHGIVLGGRCAMMVNVTDKDVEADFEIPEITKRRVKTAYLPLAPKVERKDAKGNIMKDRKGNPLMTDPSYPIENFKVKRTFKPYETFVILW